MTDKIFKYAGVSTCSGITKIRFGNDLVSRIKILTKGGCDDIDFREMPGEGLTKGECVTALMAQDGFHPEAEFVIDEANTKYNVVKVKKSKATAKTSAISNKEIEDDMKLVMTA